MLSTLTLLVSPTAAAASRLDRIREHGHLTCGIIARTAGFAALDRQGAPHGFEIDFCRAVSAVIFGTADKIEYVAATSVADFRQNPEIDLVSRRLTPTLRREADDQLSFSPIIFYDGATFLVPTASGIRTPSQLDGKHICLVEGSETEAALTRFFRGMFVAVPASSIHKAAADFFGHRCEALAADLSELAAERSAHADGLRNYKILPELISKEPLALLMHNDDAQFPLIVRWTIFALIEAEELDISLKNIDIKRISNDPEIGLFLGRSPGNGKALGLEEDWAVNLIASVGNYSEIFNRNIGSNSPLGLPRGLNALWNAGGLLYPPPMR